MDSKTRFFVFRADRNADRIPTMNTSKHVPKSIPPSASGFSILIHSRVAQWVAHIWLRLNDHIRLLLPLLHLFMLATTVTILYGVVFCNQHRPCWYDEICMLDPAYHRMTEGIWHSIAQWDSFDVVPFAPNYPLFINLLRIPIALFGVDYKIIRGMMFVLGVAPIACLLLYFRRKGIFQSKTEILLAAFSSACFTNFFCAFFVRPEAVLLCVVVLLLFAWMGNRPVLLFLTASFVPLCGIQWNVLLLPVVLHWLVFGGSLRKPLLVILAFTLSTVATVVTYHALGMWPSYLQEAARVGGLNAIPRALAKLHDAFANRDWHFLTCSIEPYDALAGDFLFVFGGLAAFLATMSGDADKRILKIWLFSCTSYYGIILAIALLANLSAHYTKVLLFVPAMLVPPLFRNTWKRYPLFLFAFVTLFSYIAFVHWCKLKHWPVTIADSANSASWVDETSLEQTFVDCFELGDVVCCDDSAYFAARSHVCEVYPLVFAFDLPLEQTRKITALILQDEPCRIYDYAWASFRKTTFNTTLQALFWDPNPSDFVNLWDYTISPDDLIEAIADRWHCRFIELPIDQPKRPGFIRFRLFRPIFPEREKIEEAKDLTKSS